MPRTFSMREFQEELESMYENGITIHGRTHSSIKAWRKADPIAFRQDYLAWLSSHGRY